MELKDFESTWRQLSEEAITGMKEWRLQHPKATFAEIETELGQRLARLRARMLQDTALASSSADWSRRSPVARQLSQRSQVRPGSMPGPNFACPPWRVGRARGTFPPGLPRRSPRPAEGLHLAHLRARVVTVPLLPQLRLRVSQAPGHIKRWARAEAASPTQGC